MITKNPYNLYHLKEKRRETSKVNTLIFGQAIEGANPGQFVMVWLPGVGEKPYCVADKDPFTITVAIAGDFSKVLHGLAVGERIWVRGPYGQGYALGGKKHLMVGGGYGAAPLLFLAKQAVIQGQAILACLGARSAEDLLLVEAFKEAGCETKVATEDGSRGMKGLVTQAATDAMEEFRPDTMYACGPLPMLSALALICKEKGIPAQLSYEALMRCGMGLCGSCELEEQARAAAGIPSGWLTCKDGPVFNMSTGNP